jgi:hypothetical protein
MRSIGAVLFLKPICTVSGACCTNVSTARTHS